jgi:hypothetical protein
MCAVAAAAAPSGRWLSWYPAAAAALFTGLYATLAGAALLVAPKTVLSELAGPDANMLCTPLCTTLSIIDA